MSSELPRVSRSLTRVGGVTPPVNPWCAAGNESAATPAFNIVFNYFACDIVRANATHAAVNPGISHSAFAASNCSSCHAGTTGVAGPTPAGAMVPVPSTTPTYWCRRP